MLPYLFDYISFRMHEKYTEFRDLPPDCYESFPPRLWGAQTDKGQGEAA